jgi:hypothetical protein
MYSHPEYKPVWKKKIFLILRLSGYILSYIISLLAEVKTADKTKQTKERKNRTEEDKIKGNEGTAGTNINGHFSLHFITYKHNHTEEMLMALSIRSRQVYEVFTI